MTESKAQPFWARRAGAYQQQTVIQPNINQNPDNAKLSVHHLSQPIDVEIYPSNNLWRVGEDDLIDDGRSDRGEPAIVQVYAVTYPKSSGDDNNIVLPEGERNEGMRTFVIDSHQPENQEAVANNPDLFPAGYLTITGSDADGLESTNNHSAIFRFNGNRWKIIESSLWNNARTEESNAQGGCYELTTMLYRDRSHERDARSTTAGIENETYDDWK